MLTVISTSSMKVRNNVEFLTADRFLAIDMQTFQDLCQITDYLITAISKLNDPASELHQQILTVQDRLFTSLSVRLAGSMDLIDSLDNPVKFNYANFGIIIAKMTREVYMQGPLKVNFKLQKVGHESSIDLKIPNDPDLAKYHNLALIVTHSLKTASTDQLMQ